MTQHDEIQFHVRWKKNKLNLLKPFVLSYGVFHYRWSYMIELQAEGETGYGEGTAISYYGWSEDLIEEQLAALPAMVTKADLFSYAGSCCAPLRHAYTGAYYDWAAKKAGKTLGNYFGLGDVLGARYSSLTISGQTVEEFAEQIESTDWDNYKIKMGTTHDHVQLAVIRQFPNKKFRIDANGGWTLDWIREHAHDLEAPNIELLEQPFPVGEDAKVREMKNYTTKPIFADESCQKLEDVHMCKGLYDGINIKLMKMGGWDPVLQILEAAQAADLQLMVGCMTESSIGISHSGQLLSRISIIDLDGSTLLKNDPADGLRLDRGEVLFSAHNGCGAILKDE